MRIRVLRVLAVSVMLALVGPLAQPAGAVTVGNGGGCTPGFWKNHESAWQEYGPNSRLGGSNVQLVFPSGYEFLADKTFRQALRWNGGDTLLDAIKNLLKHAVTAYLNAAHDDIEYPLRRFTDGGIRDMVNEAIATLDRETILDLKDELDALNNAECQASGDNTNSDN